MTDVLSKDMILTAILPHLPTAQRGKSCDNELLFILIQLILHRLKTGCQWRMLPIKEYTSKPYNWRTVYYHYNKWCKQGVWQAAWRELLKNNLEHLNLRTAQLDGTHTICKKGGQRVGYQKRKASNTSNMLCISDENGIILSASDPIEGNHHDSHKIGAHFERLVAMLQAMGINVKGLILNADAAFDCQELRKVCNKYEIEANFDLNPRNGSLVEREEYFDPEFYQSRSVIERSFAWLDAYKALLIRYETSERNWMNLNILGFMTVFLKRVIKC